MRRRVRALMLFALAVLPADVCQSQSGENLRVRLQSAPGVPIAGALVALLDARDSVIAEGLTSERGTRTLRASPGTYRVRARRIGYLPFVSQPVTVPAPGEFLLQVETPRVALQNIVVTSRSECGRADPGAATLLVVWSEVEKALRSSQITNQDLAGIGHAQTFRRVLALNGSIVSSDTTSYTIGRKPPFAAVPPEQLEKNGYVIGDEQQGWNYYAPDETILLSEQFAATHCFRLIRDKEHRGLIGVAFDPSPGRKLADITGAVWVDEATSELRQIVFQFVNAGLMSRYNAGGFTHFARLKSGAWIVDDWVLRAPLLEMHEEPYGPPHLVKTGSTEDGGRILPDTTE
jgi:Carboxypeptidase regulatory-like domain